MNVGQGLESIKLHKKRTASIQNGSLPPSHSIHRSHSQSIPSQSLVAAWSMLVDFVSTKVDVGAAGPLMFVRSFNIELVFQIIVETKPVTLCLDERSGHKDCFTPKVKNLTGEGPPGVLYSVLSST